MDMLPNEIVSKIFNVILISFGWYELFKLRSVSRRWKALVEQTLLMAERLELTGYRTKSIYEFRYPIDKQILELCDFSPEINQISLISFCIDYWTLEKLKKKCPNIQHVKLINCKISTDFNLVPRNLSDVTHLDVSGSSLRPIELEIILYALPNLYSFVYNNTRLACFAQLGGINIYQNLKTVRGLSLDLINYGNQSERAFENICKGLNLLYLSVNISFINDIRLFSLKKLKNLKILKLQFYSSRIGILKMPHMNSLKELYLKEVVHTERALIDDEFIKNLLTITPFLCKLHLEFEYLNEFKFKYLFSSTGFDEFFESQFSLEQLSLINVCNLHIKNFETFGKSKNLMKIIIEGTQNITFEMIEMFLLTKNKTLVSKTGIKMSPNCVVRLETCLKYKLIIKECKLYRATLL